MYDEAGSERVHTSKRRSAFQSQIDYQKAFEHHETHLKIATESSDRAGELAAYGNLGNAYYSLGDNRKAIQYLEKQLEIAKEIGDQDIEKTAYGSLGNSYRLVGDHRKAIE